MTDHGLQLLRCQLSRITEIDFMVTPCIGDAPYPGSCASGVCRRKLHSRLFQLVHPDHRDLYHLLKAQILRGAPAVFAFHPTFRFLQIQAAIDPATDRSGNVISHVLVPPLFCP